MFDWFSGQILNIDITRWAQNFKHFQRRRFKLTGWSLNQALEWVGKGNFSDFLGDIVVGAGPAGLSVDQLSTNKVFPK